MLIVGIDAIFKVLLFIQLIFDRMDYLEYPGLVLSIIYNASKLQIFQVICDERET